MNKVKKILTTLMAATLTVSTGLTSMPMFAHNVKAESKAETISSDTNDMSQYKKINGISSQTVLGADFSHYQLQKNAWKKVWKNYKGIEVSNVFEYVRSQGINTISVKVAVNPTKDKEGNESYLSLENAKKTLKEAKKAGLKTNVTLLYSDDITYAGVQKLPDGWDTDSAEEKALEYTKNVIKELKAADAVPTMITIGNEVNYNFLNMSSGDGWEGFVAMSKISKMIREEGIKPAVSVSAPTTDASDIQWIIGKLGNADVDYDYIGVNIYPDTHNENYVKTLKNTVEEKAAGKQMIISSVKCPWKDSEGKASITTQTKSIYDYLQATIDEKNAGGLIYNDADFVGAWDSFFDENGQAMSSLAIFAYAQGNQVDVSTYKDPWEYGGDTGLKNLTASVKKLNNMSQSSIRGMDISSYTALKKAGVKYYDFDGKETSLLKVLHDNGVNYIRIRIWNDPTNEKGETYGGGANDVAAGLEIAKEAAQYDMKLLLDFHYSDFWADPGQQRKPKDWENLSFKELKEAVFSYTRDTLTALKEEDVLPDIVQIGNEIRSGLLFPDGELPDYTKMVQLVNAGIRGARAAAGKDEMQVMIHLDQGGRYFYLKEWFDCSFEAGLEDFDLIGLSYYPFWHGTFTDLKETMTKLIQDYKKPIMVVETAHAWRKSAHGFIDEQQEKIAGFPATPAGQKQVLDLVANIVASLPDEMGQGIYYWEPICVPKDGEGGWSENMGLLEEKGTIMEGIRSFLFTRNDACPEKPAKIYEPEPMTVVKDEACGLPEMLPVLLYDGMVEQRRVNWNEVPDTRVTGEYDVTGNVEGVPFAAHAKICVVEELPEAENLLLDVGWEDGLARWNVEKSEDAVAVQLFPEFVDPFPAPPVNAVRVEAPKNFTFSICQTVKVQEAGTYTLSVAFQGTDTTNVDVRLFLNTEEGKEETVIHPTEHAWTGYKVTCEIRKPQEVTAGIRISSPPMYGMMRNFCLQTVKREGQ